MYLFDINRDNYGNPTNLNHLLYLNYSWIIFGFSSSVCQNESFDNETITTISVKCVAF